MKFLNFEDYLVNEVPSKTSKQVRVEVLCPTCSNQRGVALKPFRCKFRKSLKTKKLLLCQSCGSRKARTPDVIAKQKLTNLRLYGYENPLSNRKIQDQIKATNLRLYGYENPFSDRKIQDQIKATNLTKFGCENPSQNEKVRASVRATHEKNWGWPFLLQVPVLREKVRQSNIKKYGGVHKKQGALFLKNNITSERELCAKLLRYLRRTGGKCNDSATLKHFHTTTGTTLTRLLYKFGHERFLKKSTISTGERELYNFLLELLVPAEWVVRNDRTALGGKEIDVYIPTLRFGIEYNGNIWHSERFNPDPKYHLSKRLKAESLGIILILIRSDEWEFKREVVQSIIKNSLVRAMERYVNSPPAQPR